MKLQKINYNNNNLSKLLKITNGGLFNNLDIKTIDGYYITLLDWSEVDKVINLFDKESDSMDIRYSEAYNANVLGLTKLLKNLLTSISTLVLILYIVILVDLILDGKNKSKMLYTIGLDYNGIIKLVVIQFVIYLSEFIFISSILMIVSKYIVLIK